MKKLIVCCALISLSLVVSGCAGICTYPARPNEARGIRVYPQKIYLLVGAQRSQLVSLPDVKNGYDIKPWSFLSKHDFTIKIEDAAVKELDSKQDSSAALSLLQKMVELAAKAAEMPVGLGREPGIRAMAVVEFASPLGFKPGIYELSQEGMLKRVGPQKADAVE
jgi:hypothetical protein